MQFASHELARARAQGLTVVTAVAGTLISIGLLLGSKSVGVPGLIDPVPAVRVFPALFAGTATLCLLEPWQIFEVAGARALWRRRTFRFAAGSTVVVLAGGVLARNAGSPSILVLSLLLYAGLAVAVGTVGTYWWVLVAVALYGQLFVQAYEEFRPGLAWSVGAGAAAGVIYLWRGEATLGRSPT